MMDKTIFIEEVFNKRIYSNGIQMYPIYLVILCFTEKGPVFLRLLTNKVLFTYCLPYSSPLRKFCLVSKDDKTVYKGERQGR